MFIKYLGPLKNQNETLNLLGRNNELTWEREGNLSALEKANWLGRDIAVKTQTNTDIQKPEE